MRPLAFFALLTWVLPACNSVLGIDQAEHDQTLDPPGSTGLAAAAGASGGGGSSGASGSSGQAGAAGAPIDEVCASYCSDVMANCTDTLQEYPSVEVCLAMCSKLDNGPESDLSSNTVECRANHARLAKTEPDQRVTHCLAAGPLGGKTCGTPCQAFCVLNLALCTPPTLPASTYPAGAQCIDQCEMLAYQMLEQSDFAGAKGNTVNCRDYHMQAAYKSEASAKTHCPHTAFDSPTCN